MNVTQTLIGIRRFVPSAVASLALCIGSVATPAEDPLPSWNAGPAKTAILQFVAAVTDENGEGYVKPADRIATFDNDGTLWVEQPIYTQITFLFDRVKELAPKHPEWKTIQPFKALLEGDMKTVAALGDKGILQMAMATHAGMTADEFTSIVNKWFKTAKHPRFKKLYTQCVYLPQLELMSYLRDNGFKTFIVSGGGIEFMRPWTAEVYGIPPAQVVGSSVVTEFQIKRGKPVLVRQPMINFIDDKAGRPVGIYQHIGQRPILAFGNADADMQMIQYTKAGDGVRLRLFLHHTDADREYAYDRPRPGRLTTEVELSRAIRDTFLGTLWSAQVPVSSDALG